MSVPPDIYETLKKALEETKRRFKDDIATTFISEWRQTELDKMDAALAWLDAQQPGAPAGEAREAIRFFAYEAWNAGTEEREQHENVLKAWSAELDAQQPGAASKVRQFTPTPTRAGGE